MAKRNKKNKTSNPTQENLEEMTWVGHLNEFRIRLLKSVAFFLIAFLFSAYYSKEILGFLLSPLLNTQTIEGFIYTSLTEGFSTSLRIAFFTSFLVSLPVIFFQIWRFISPGLYSYEKKNYFIIFLLSPVLFIGSICLVYYFVMPAAWNFFIKFNVIEYDYNKIAALYPKVSEYLSLTITLITGFGIVSQLPILFIILVNLNVIGYEGLVKKRRIFVVISFLFAAILTPPDIVSQLVMAGILLLFYELIIIYAKLKVNK
jgi:sec-independent protein translocase protein TatC